jgi:N6-adenosine-specific RNA methylase IME4
MTKPRIILADPPWEQNARNNPDTSFGLGCKYPTMKTADIMALPVKEIAADNAALLLWVTWPKLIEGIRVMGAWGFKYKTLGFLWLKLNKNSRAPFYGIGHYTKSNCEVCLLGIRGRMEVKSNHISQVIEQGTHVDPFLDQKMDGLLLDLKGIHSAKPPESKAKIIRLFGDLPRMELFARETSHGFEAIGNGIDGRDIREVLNERKARY